MSLIDIFFLAFALAMDACIVSFSQGLIVINHKGRNSFMLACSVGIFQALMPIIGWLLAKSVSSYVETVDHWIAFAIFMGLGVKFIMDAFKEDTDMPAKSSEPFSVKYLLLISFATSIDAFAAGVTLLFAKTGILVPAVIIGLITFINSLVGFWFGYVFKKFPSQLLEILAGVLLIGLGVKVLFEHLEGSLAVGL